MLCAIDVAWRFAVGGVGPQQRSSWRVYNVRAIAASSTCPVPAPAQANSLAVCGGAGRGGAHTVGGGVPPPPHPPSEIPGGRHACTSAVCAWAIMRAVLACEEFGISAGAEKLALLVTAQHRGDSFPPFQHTSGRYRLWPASQASLPRLPGPLSD
jgi:hypothetical protein